jgi:pre-rRNA-processing protein TSR3
LSEHIETVESTALSTQPRLHPVDCIIRRPGPLTQMNILIIDYGQDDPGKCTAKKMVKMGLATEVSRKFHAASSILVLNPFAEITLSPVDKDSKGILDIDCSWVFARDVFHRKLGGKHRRLPSLLAGNPTNYSKLGMLSSLEAVAASLYILGEKEDAKRFLSIYKWGPTFLTLNADPLEEYSQANSEDEVRDLEREFFREYFAE